MFGRGPFGKLPFCVVVLELEPSSQRLRARDLSGPYIQARDESGPYIAARDESEGAP